MENKPKKYLLPFSSVVELESAYKQIVNASKISNALVIEKLKEHSIPYKEIEPCILTIDMSNVPKEIDLFSLIDCGKDVITLTYNQLGVITLDKD